MLKVESLVSNDKWNHKNYWEALPVTYPNSRYVLLKNRLLKDTLKTKVAHRILLNNLYIISTIKMGHDGKLFLKEDKAVLALL